MKTTYKNSLSGANKWYFIAIIILAVITYIKLFSSGFMSWDDGEVLLNNKDVQQFNVKAFFTSYYVGNYAPVSMIGFAIDWLLFHGNAAGHHAMSLLFHIINTFLVFKLCHLIFNDNQKALLCAIIFCFHPLQVETVAWVSAKNNLVCSAFFLSGLIWYLKYIREKLLKNYIISLLVFALAVLSKPSAVCFPLCLFIIDYLENKPFKLNSVFINKIPFLVVSLVIGIATIYTRTEDKFINDSHAFAWHERIGYAGYAILQYFIKFLAPINLSVIYPYPQNKTMSLLIGYFIIAIAAFGIYKLIKSKNKILVFGLLFLIANLLLVLQFIPFGEVLTADRYMYLPIIGIAIMAAHLIKLKQVQVQIVSLVVLLVFGGFTFARTAVWKNSVTLYSDILKKYPHSFVALNSLGAQYMLNKNYDLSLRYLNSAINENTQYYKGYYNRGLLFAQTDRMKDAIKDFDKAIALKKYHKAYVARANAYYSIKDFPKAISDAQEVLNSEPDNIKANFVMANCYDELNQLNKALLYYNKLISLNPENALFYMQRGILHGKMQQFQLCLADLDSCIKIEPNYAEAYYWKGVAKVNMKQNPCEDLKMAVNLGFQQAQQPLITYCR